MNRTSVLALISFILLTACGKTGDLYLPDDQAAPASTESSDRG